MASITGLNVKKESSPRSSFSRSSFPRSSFPRSSFPRLSFSRSSFPRSSFSRSSFSGSSFPRSSFPTSSFSSLSFSRSSFYFIFSRSSFSRSSFFRHPSLCRIAIRLQFCFRTPPSSQTFRSQKVFLLYNSIQFRQTTFSLDNSPRKSLDFFGRLRTSSGIFFPALPG